MSGAVTLEYALEAHEAGLCIMPPREDGTKAPLETWKDLQQNRPSESKIRAWYANGRNGIGVICGKVSGNLDMLEFEGRAVNEGLSKSYKAACLGSGIGSILNKLVKGYYERTPSGGYHFLYRLADGEVGRNTKLARRPATDEELRTSDDKTPVLIETRGEGGFVVLAPSGGPVHSTGKSWEIQQGSLQTIPTLTVEERDRLFAIAQMFDQMEKRPLYIPKDKQPSDKRPGDDFNDRADWGRDVLEPAGWSRTGENHNGWEEWYRGANARKGWTSAGVSPDGQFLHAFSTSTDLPTEGGLSKFTAYAYLFHNGKFEEAALELKRKGYGLQTATVPVQKGGEAPTIPPPRIEEVGAGYRLVFPEHRIEIHVSRVHWSKDEPVAVYAISRLPLLAGQPTVRIEHGSLNLYAARTRATLAKDLSQRLPIDWSALLEQASAAVINAETQGEELIPLKDVDDDEAPELMGSLCLREDPSMIFGHGGDGKSYLALAGALSLATGYPYLGIEPESRMRVAYLDWEYTGKAHKRRMRRLLGSEEEPEDLLYLACKLPLVQLCDRLAAAFNRYGVQYCIIDSVALACGGSPEESQLANSFITAARQLGVGYLAVAHVNRNAETNMPFGSVFWHNGMRSTWYCKKEQEIGGSQINLGLFHRKANGEKLERPMAYTLDFSDGKTVITKVDAARTEGLSDEVPTGDRIAAALAAGPVEGMDYQQLHEATGISRATLERTLNKDPRFSFSEVSRAGKGRPRRAFRLAGVEDEESLPEAES